MSLKKNSFTLIELLVVVGILALLIAMFLPSLRGVREKGWSTKCKSNLRNLQVAAMGYAYANDGYLPEPYAWEEYSANDEEWHERKGWVNWLDWPAGHDPGSPSSHEYGDPPPWWGTRAYDSITNGTLWGYTGKSLDVYVCPKFERSEVCGVNDPVDGNPFSTTNRIYRSYAMNRLLHNTRISDVQASRRLLFCDVHPRAGDQVEGEQAAYRGLCDVSGNANSFGNYSYDATLSGTRYQSTEYPVEAIGSFHQGHGNVIFIDGHVEELSWQHTTNACSGRW